MMYRILVYLIMGLHSHSYGACTNAFMVNSGEEFHQMRNHVSVLLQMQTIHGANVILIRIIFIQYCKNACMDSLD